MLQYKIDLPNPIVNWLEMNELNTVVGDFLVSIISECPNKSGRRRGERENIELVIYSVIMSSPH